MPAQLPGRCAFLDTNDQMGRHRRQTACSLEMLKFAVSLLRQLGSGCCVLMPISNSGTRYDVPHLELTQVLGEGK